MIIVIAKNAVPVLIICTIPRGGNPCTHGGERDLVHVESLYLHFYSLTPPF